MGFGKPRSAAGTLRVHRTRRLLTALACVGLTLGGAHAQVGTDFAPDDALEETLIDACFGSNKIDTVALFQTDPDRALRIFNLCSNAFPGELAASPGDSSRFASNINLGTIGRGTSGTGKLGDEVRKRLQEREDDSNERRSADGRSGGSAGESLTIGDMGVFFTGQVSDTDRNPTRLENGFDDTASSFVLGADYGFDTGVPFLLGIAVSREENRTRFEGGNGRLDSLATSLMLYGSVSPLDGVTLNVYLGRSHAENETDRPVSLGNLSGIVRTQYDSDRVLGGVGAAYDLFLGDWNITLAGNLDYTRTRVDAHRENGTTALEVDFERQRQRSLIGSLGLGLGHTTWFEWGSVTPRIEARYAHEFENDARTIKAALQVAPDRRVVFLTDSPDRHYGFVGGGLTIQTNGGLQLFANYEQMLGHAYMRNKAVFGGVAARF
ncbi:MAG: autotransporter outer membrane beta-barrel domain-containing protein [Gammaproteobacteria bacterium]|nr:autotransporter outer membrane beta-barrel domain-containing protein [Gammaproteobacteria bacterium]